MPNLKNYQTLFLDRDGVINQRTPGTYVTKPEEFHFYEGVPQAIAQLSQLFDYIIIVTNQAGIGRGVMTEEDLENVHAHLLSEIEKAGGQIDAIYHSPYRPEQNSDCRKPNTGMALQAQHDFPDIDFESSIIVGDSASDMEFGKRLGMATVLITGKEEEEPELEELEVDFRFEGLVGFVGFLMSDL
jgi:D-glycero-D-manno-heptose 1,7-bisphosphate phosphatase